MNIPLIMKIGQIIVVVIVLLEAIFGAGTGADKKKAAIDAIKQVAILLGLVIPAFIADNLGVFIDIVVSVFNSFGFFTKSKT